MSPPLAYEVQGGYRVGSSGDLTKGGLLCYTDIIENSTGYCIAIAQGISVQQAEAHASMIVACLNRVQG